MDRLVARLTDPGGPELPTEDFRALLVRTDRYLSGYALLLLGLICFHDGRPGWSVGWAIAAMAGYIAVNAGLSQILARQGHIRRFEPFRYALTLVALAILFKLMGGARSRQWYVFGLATVGLSAHYLVLRLRSALPLALIAVLYLALCLAGARELAPADIADVVAQTGFLLLLSAYFSYLVHFLLEHNARLSEGKSRFQQLAENISEVFWITDAKRHQIVYVSPAYEDVWGRSAEVLVRNPLDWLEAIDTEDLPMVLEATRQAGVATDVEYRVRRPDGSVRHIRDRAFPVRDENGTVVRVAGIAEDVTELKAAARREEEQRAALVSASKMSSLGEMAAGIAHEINNPLMIIQGKSQQILRLARDETINRETLQQYARKIDETAGRIDHIIRGLRSFAKDDRRRPVESTPVIRILNDTLAFCEARFRSHGIELLVDPFPPSLSVECRPVQISQVLLNLLNNAFDAVESLPRKCVLIHVQDTDGRVDIAVQDTGPGVPPELRDKILQPFFTTKGQGRGTGLGLSISRGIAESHGGRLDLDPTYTGGARFVLSLPRSPR